MGKKLVGSYKYIHTPEGEEGAKKAWDLIFEMLIEKRKKRLKDKTKTE